MKTSAAVAALGALAHESRLAMYRLLVTRGTDGYNPGELAERLRIPAPTLSFHLKELQQAKLVSSRREGRFLRYSANFPLMHQVVGFLTENCCSQSDLECDSSCIPVQMPTRKRA
jgi:ArsR family transcriptional regulator